MVCSVEWSSWPVECWLAREEAIEAGAAVILAISDEMELRWRVASAPEEAVHRLYSDESSARRLAAWAASVGWLSSRGAMAAWTEPAARAKRVKSRNFMVMTVGVA